MYSKDELLSKNMLIAGTKKPVIYTQNGSTQNAKVMKKPPIIISVNILRRETTGSTTPNLPIKEKSYARTHY